MDIEKVKDIVSNIECRDWNIELIDGIDSFWIDSYRYVPCPYTGGTFKQCLSVNIGEDDTEESLVEEVVYQIAWMEFHEVFERFKYRGENLYPHAKTP